MGIHSHLVMEDWEQPLSWVGIVVVAIFSGESGNFIFIKTWYDQMQNKIMGRFLFAHLYYENLIKYFKYFTNVPSNSCCFQ